MVVHAAVETDPVVDIAKPRTYLDQLVEISKARKLAKQAVWDARVAETVTDLKGLLAEYEGGKAKAMIEDKIGEKIEKETVLVQGHIKLGVVNCFLALVSNSDNVYNSTMNEWLKKNDLDGLAFRFQTETRTQDDVVPCALSLSWSFEIP